MTLEAVETPDIHKVEFYERRRALLRCVATRPGFAEKKSRKTCLYCMHRYTFYISSAALRKVISAI